MTPAAAAVRRPLSRARLALASRAREEGSDRRLAELLAAGRREGPASMSNVWPRWRLSTDSDTAAGGAERRFVEEGADCTNPSSRCLSSCKELLAITADDDWDFLDSLAAARLERLASCDATSGWGKVGCTKTTNQKGPNQETAQFTTNTQSFLLTSVCIDRLLISSRFESSSWESFCRSAICCVAALYSSNPWSN